MKKNTIIIAPNAGFANRLRTIVASIYLSEKLNMDIEHLWIGTSYICANKNIQNIHDKSFDYYFKNNVKKCNYNNWINKINTVYTEWQPDNKGWYNVQSYGQKLLKINNFKEIEKINLNMNSSESFLIESSHLSHLNISTKDKTRIYQKYIIPNDIFLNKLEKKLLLFNNESIIGISIRKGDFIYYFHETQISDDIIENWIKTLPNKIYFCSDDKLYQKEMRKKIPNHISFNCQEMESQDLDENQDFFDFILLSKCCKIYGTHKSSFCEEAAYLGGIEYNILNKDFLQI